MNLRPTSALFLSSLVRRAFSEGTFATIEKRGAEEAGAIFLRFRHRDGTVTLLGPALQGFDEDLTTAPGGRLVETRLEKGDEGEAATILDKELRFDNDLWIVEIEDEYPADWVRIASS